MPANWEAFDHERVEAGAGFRLPRGRQIDVAVQLAGVRVIHVEGPEQFELRVRVRGEDVAAYRVDVVLQRLTEEIRAYAGSVTGDLNPTAPKSQQLELSQTARTQSDIAMGRGTALRSERSTGRRGSRRGFRRPG